MAPDTRQPLHHHPGPRVVVYAAMVLVAAVSLPAYVIEPARALGGGGVFGLLVILVFELGLFSIAHRRVILDTDGTTLTLRDARWPFAARLRQVPIAELRGVTVQKAPRGTARRLSLTLAAGKEMPLTTSYYGDTGHMDRDAAAIRALCGLPPARAA